MGGGDGVGRGLELCTKYCVFNISVKDISSVRVIDFGNSIRNVHREISLYYKDFEVQSLLYRAPEVTGFLPVVFYCLVCVRIVLSICHMN